MKRRKTKTGKPRKAASVPAPPKKKPMSRREMLGLAKFAAVGLAVFGGGGFYVVSKVQASIQEGDLSKIGNGTLAIVQVHDPQCPSCNALQRATRDALCELEAGDVNYLVANLTMPDGRDFAREQGAGRVTLILFDGEGKRRRTITGRRSVEELRSVFREHLARYGAKPAEG